MTTRYDKAFTRLFLSVIGGDFFGVMFASQLGGGPNTGGVFPAPLLIFGLLGMPVAAILFIVSAIQVFVYRKDPRQDEKKEDAQPIVTANAGYACTRRAEAHG
jgi:hypothetical protein